MAGPVKRRKEIPKKLRAVLALRHNGLCSCGCGARLMPGFHIQHDPPLELRLWDEATQDTIPRANDPNYMFPMTSTCHVRVTNHPIGPHTVLNSDRHAIDKNRRLRGEVKGKPKRDWGKRPMRDNFHPRVKDINDE